MRHRLRLLVGIVTVALLASSCASKADLAKELAADAASTAQGTSRVAATVTIRSPGMSLSFTQTGAFDYAHSRGFLRTAAGGEGPFSQEVFLPGHMYVKLPKDGGSPLPGKSWVDVNLAQPDNPGGFMMPGGFNGAAQSSPSDMLSFLFGISTRVTQVGSATVRGVQTVHYRVWISLAKASSRVRPSARAVFRTFAKAFGRSAIPAQVWVDEQGRVRRITVMLVPPKSSGAPAGSTITQAVDFYDFGIPVRVSAPPASEVLGASAFMKGSSSGVSYPAPPPAARGTLSPAAAKAAERAVRAFWTGIGAGDAKAAAQAVAPAQRSCLLAFMKDLPRLKVASLRIISARPGGTARAVVIFKVTARPQLPGNSVSVGTSAMLPGVAWLAATRIANRWYVDLNGQGTFFPPCSG